MPPDPDTVDVTVWAPHRVRVVVDGAEHTLARTAGGWWRVEVDAELGSDYAFRLDDEETPLPDPRSRWQPHGVHAASRVYDHGAFGWTVG